MTDEPTAAGVQARRAPSRQSAPWRAGIVLPVVAAVLGSLLITALTPLGEIVREVIFPTRATITGAVVMGDAPVADAVVTLDGSFDVRTTANGDFVLTDVAPGRHEVRVDSAAGQSLTQHLVVARGDVTRELEQVVLQPRYRLRYAATVVPQGPRSRTMDYDVAAWIDGVATDLDRITAVSYELPAPLTQGAVAGGSRAQSFCYRELGSVPIDDVVVLGTSVPVTARIDIGGAQALVLTWDAQTPSRPPVDCLTVEVAAVDDDDDTDPANRRRTVPLVPGVVGLRLADAQVLIRNAGLVVGDVTVADRPGAPGVVLEAAPAPGQRVDRGSAVALVVSREAVDVELPPLIGLDRDEARSALEARGLVVHETYEVAPDAPIGQVVDSVPPEGADVEAGSTVTLTVSNQEVGVPDVIGRTFVEAREKLEGSGFIVSRVPEATTDAARDGIVSAQSPAPDENAWQWTEVRVTVGALETG